MTKLIIYAYTFPSLIIAGKYFGHIKTKVGQTTYRPNEKPEHSVHKRISEQMGTSNAEHYVLLHYWVIEQTSGLSSDKDLHNRFLSDGICRTDGRGTEWFEIPYTKETDVVRCIENYLDNHYYLSLWKKVLYWIWNSVRAVFIKKSNKKRKK